MSHANIVNGFEIDAGGVISVVDLDAIAIGGEKACQKICLEKRDFLRVSKDFRINSPCKAAPHMDEYVIAPLPLACHKSRSVICFRACKMEEGEDLVVDMGLTFEGDKVFEFGHYILWNPENGELSISEELDWIEITKTDLKRWESKLVPDGAVK